MTRRLFAYIGLPMLIAYAAVFYYGVFGFALCCIAGIVCAVFQFFKRYDKYDKRVFALIGVVIYVAITVFCFYDLRQKEISSVYDGKTVNLRAEVIADRYPSKGYYNYLLRAEEIDGKSVDFNINLSVKYELTQAAPRTCCLSMISSFPRTEGSDISLFMSARRCQTPQGS